MKKKWLGKPFLLSGKAFFFFKKGAKIRFGFETYFFPKRNISLNKADDDEVVLAEKGVGKKVCKNGGKGAMGPCACLITTPPLLFFKQMYYEQTNVLNTDREEKFWRFLFVAGSQARITGSTRCTTAPTGPSSGPRGARPSPLKMTRYTFTVKTTRFHIFHSRISITRALKFGVVGVAVQFPVGKVARIVSQLPSELSEQSPPRPRYAGPIRSTIWSVQ